MHRAKPKPRLGRKAPLPNLRFTPYAWSKLLYLRDLGETEVGGFGLSAADDLLLVVDVVLVRQSCTAVTVRFDDDAVADFFDDQVDQGLNPARFARIWIHTHPGMSAEPSSRDEETFNRCFGKADWALMFILACGGQTYARLRFNVGPGSEVLLPVEVDFNPPFPGADWQAWDEEYSCCVQPEIIQRNDLSDLACHDVLEDLSGPWPEHFQDNLDLIELERETLDDGPESHDWRNRHSTR